MLSTMSAGTVSPISHLQQQRHSQREDRQIVVMQTTQCTISALADVRPLVPKQEEDPMFPTPESSPRYANSDGNGYAQDIGFYSSPHHSPTSMAGIEHHPMPSLSPNGSYMGGPGSPCSDYYCNSSPYSPPYDNSSPHSIDCSPHPIDSCCSPPHSTTMNGIPCTGGPADPFTSVAGPGGAYMPADSMTSMCNSSSPLPPVSSMLTSAAATFPTEIENKCINSMSIIGHGYPPISQEHNPAVFVDPHGIPSFANSFCGPPPPPPPHAQPGSPASLVRVGSENSISEGELQIRMIDQQFPVQGEANPIEYYDSPVPESPPTSQALYNGVEGLPMPKDGAVYPAFLVHPPVSQHSLLQCGPFYPQANDLKPVMKPRGRVCSGKGPKVRPPPKVVHVDDSEIKDIPTSAQLWEFTLRVIKKPKYHYMVNWENQKEGLFRFHDAQAFAALWGKHRNRPHMTYDKVARALRYYYKRDILNQVGGRLTYKFSKRLSKLYTNEE